MYRKKSLKRIVSLILVIMLAVPAAACSKQEETKYTGIISAMDNEVELLLAEADIDHVDTVGGVDFNVGTLEGRPVVIAKSGVGKVMAASGVSTMLNRYDISEVIFTGIAGGVGDETEVLDEVVATALVQHDYGNMTNDGFVWSAGESVAENEKTHGEKGYFYCDEDLVSSAYEAATEVVGSDHTHKGIIATGDQFIASEEYSEKLKSDFDALACEMEGAAIAAVCIEFDTPFVVIRAMSDKADGKAHDTIENMGDIAADNSSRIVMQMLGNM